LCVRVRDEPSDAGVAAVAAKSGFARAMGGWHVRAEDGGGQVPAGRSAGGSNVEVVLCSCCVRCLALFCCSCRRGTHSINPTLVLFIQPCFPSPSSLPAPSTIQILTSQSLPPIYFLTAHPAPSLPCHHPNCFLLLSCTTTPRSHALLHIQHSLLPPSLSHSISIIIGF